MLLLPLAWPEEFGGCVSGIQEKRIMQGAVISSPLLPLGLSLVSLALTEPERRDEVKGATLSPEGPFWI